MCLLMAGRVEHVRAKKIADATGKIREILVFLDGIPKHLSDNRFQPYRRRTEPDEFENRWNSDTDGRRGDRHGVAWLNRHLHEPEAESRDSRDC